MKFLQEPDILGHKFLAIQVSQRAGIRLKVKLQLVRIKRLVGKSGSFVHGVFSVFSISGQGVTNGSEVGPDLMGAPGEQLHFHQGEIPALFQNTIPCSDTLGTVPGFLEM